LTFPRSASVSLGSAEQELADTNETLADLGNVNQSIAAAKRKLESEFNQLGVRIFCNIFLIEYFLLG